MQDINQVALTARLTTDPELRSTPNGTSVTTLRVAIQRPGERGAAFYESRFWGKLSESCASYLAKGARDRLSTQAAEAVIATRLGSVARRAARTEGAS